jgi:CelD/BcsL family acetyltransferase involved in cellulose biosynthesis
VRDRKLRELPVNAASAAPLVDVRVCKGVDAAVDEVAASADSRHAFLRAAWFEAAAGGAATTLVASRRDGRAIMALPSVPVGPGLLGCRAVPGSYWPIRSFPIAADAREWELHAFLASRVTKKALGNALRIGPANSNDPTIRRLVAVAPGSGWTVLARRVATSFNLDIVDARKAGPWPRSSTLKKNRFHEKHLGGHGELEWRHISGLGWTPAVFDDLAEIERKSWLGAEGGDAKFLCARQRAIWEHAAADPGLAEMMTVGMLYIAGEPVAFSFGIDAGRTRYCIATGYDQAFAKHSPGKVLSYRTYMEAAERGIEFLDDGAGDGGHKKVMGETPGPEIMDYLLVRGRLATGVLRRLWERSGR